MTPSQKDRLKNLFKARIMDFKTGILPYREYIEGGFFGTDLDSVLGIGYLARDGGSKAEIEQIFDECLIESGLNSSDYHL